MKKVLLHPATEKARALLISAGYRMAAQFVSVCPTSSQGPRDLIALALRNANVDFFQAVSIARELTR